MARNRFCAHVDALGSIPGVDIAEHRERNGECAQYVFAGSAREIGGVVRFDGLSEASLVFFASLSGIGSEKFNETLSPAVNTTTSCGFISRNAWLTRIVLGKRYAVTVGRSLFLRNRLILLRN